MVCDEVKNLLLSKNLKYGDSAINPIRLFSSSSNEEQIKVRIDDKLSRIRNQPENEDEDATLDLIGYLVLLKVAKKIKEEKPGANDQLKSPTLTLSELNQFLEVRGNPPYPS
jgi:hypothetical protein